MRDDGSDYARGEAVEFVGGGEAPDAGADSGVDAARAGPRRWWWAAGLAAVIAGALVWGFTRPNEATPTLAGSSAPVPAHTVSPTPTETVTHGAPAPTPSPPRFDLPVPRQTPAGLTDCFGAPGCTVSVQVPDAVARALHQRLPGRAAVQVRSYLGQAVSSGSTYLAGREIDARSALGELRIRVRRHIAGNASIRFVPGPSGPLWTQTAFVSTAAFDVAVSYTHPRRAGATTIDLHRLAADQRLIGL